MRRQQREKTKNTLGRMGEREKLHCEEEGGKRKRINLKRVKERNMVGREGERGGGGGGEGGVVREGGGK